MNTEGRLYEFGLPVYNTAHKDVSFSVESSSATTDAFTTYDEGTENSLNNKSGSDHRYSATNIPAYAHSFLLTAIYSPDYVDLGDVEGGTDGPSEDDMGSYVKFNYYRSSTAYNWRAPYYNANFVPVNYSNDEDDMATYSYGTKELMYVKSIETKTHIAVFELGSRDDAIGSKDENGGKSTNHGQSKKLEKIKLYKKNSSGNELLKTIEFEYDYSLCKGPELNSTNASTGKLTLTKISILHEGSLKGRLSPYQFEYNNQNYELLETDRWGYYQPSRGGEKLYNNVSPYTHQDLSQANRDTYASYWNLSKIKLPSGGEINIDYERDDYGYVQDRRAMQMCRITNTGNSSSKSGTGKINTSNLYVYFKLKEPIPNDSEKLDKLKEYLVGVDKVYFKVWQKLGKLPDGASQDIYDFVEGYAETDFNLSTNSGFGFTNASTNGSGEFTEAYFQVKKVPAKTRKGKEFTKAHPFQLAGWQYLRLKRPDLFMPDMSFGHKMTGNDLLKPAKKLIKFWKNQFSKLRSFYKMAAKEGYASSIEISGTEMPSFVRLNSPDQIKYGGGHRVKQITMDDGWDDINSSQTNHFGHTYGNTYEYRNTDGTSSGVASYEPAIGNEENPFRVPNYYANDDAYLNDQSLYIEEPYNESLFPSPVVGYERITVKPLDRTFVYQSETKSVAASHPGYQVHEFYTAKDYPVISKSTAIEYLPDDNNSILGFVGIDKLKSIGFSQGYSIELNNMHGKPKKVSKYSINENAPTEITEYRYSTYKGYPGILNNDIKVLNNNTEFDRSETKTVGKQVDVFTDVRESSVLTEVADLSTNISTIIVLGIPILAPSAWPNYDKTENLFRSVATNKVITKTAILNSIIRKKAEATITENYEFYDELSGQPLLISRSNNFGDQIVEHNFPATWAYEDMGPASSNIGLDVNSSLTSNYDLVLNKGDVLQSYGVSPKKYWVDQVSSTAIRLIDEDDNQSSTLPTAEVIHSGNTNQQSYMVGNTVSIKNMVDDNATLPVFEIMNFDSENQFMGDIPFLDCYGQEYYFSNCFIEPASNDDDQIFKIYIEQIQVAPTGNWDCNIEITFPSINNSFNMANEFNIGGHSCPPSGSPGLADSDLQITLNNDGSITINDVTNSITSTSVTGASEACGLRCYPGVLHTSAHTLHDVWEYEYEDFDYSSLEEVVDDNPYRYGKKGIWRKDKTYTFLEIRKQEDPHTDARFDGTLNRYYPYDWNDQSQNANSRWTLANTVTEYNLNGFILEEMDALERYSAALYGHDNQLPVAVAKNASYYEIVYDGFEEHGASYVEEGHIKFESQVPTLSSDEAHTGDHSIYLNNQSATFTTSVGGTDPEFIPKADEKYYLSCWVKMDADATDAYVIVNNGTADTLYVDYSISAIEGWRRIEGVITAPSSGNLTIQINALTGKVYFDDFRIQPLNSSMKTYVYNPTNLRLSAELDENNFATFYNYDELGNLIQTKKETVKGILTLQTGRKNIAQ